MRLGLIGCGLIGVSAAWAMKKAGSVDSVLAYNRHAQSAKRMVELGIADASTEDMCALASTCDAVMVAVPVRVMPSVFQTIAPALDPKTIVTDVGSVRGFVVEAARKAFGPAFPRYAALHPIAGGEKSGIDAARVDLFEGANVISTPTPETDPKVLARWESLWVSTGARIRRMSVEEHDAVFGCVSHLPHVLSYALVDMVAERENAKTHFNLVGGGFRDFTRIAASSPEMWRDICLTNAEAILRELDDYTSKVSQLRDAIERHDAKALEAIFTRAAHARRSEVR